MNPSKRTIGFQIGTDLSDRIEHMAIRSGLPKSTFLRQLIEKTLDLIEWGAPEEELLPWPDPGSAHATGGVRIIFPHIEYNTGGAL